MTPDSTRPASAFREAANHAFIALFFAFSAAFVFSTSAAEHEVRASLHIPPAETYVIGDAVPLHWRFENKSSVPLAFMWEGCCRLNGRLNVAAPGKNIQPIAPGQAIAHMFAKAEKLDPNQPRDFDTRLGDWVALTETGEYELRGHYTGVLPTQKPMVARGLNLWRDAAETDPIKVKLLSVGDYLSQRETRSAQRGIKLNVTASPAIPPLGPNTLEVSFTNSSAAPLTIRWPDAVELWILDPSGNRLTGVPTQIDGTYEEMKLAPGAVVKRPVDLTSDLFEGQRFGTYRVFVDLRAEDNQARVPSNAHSVEWRFGTNEVRELLTHASKGGRTGGRNAALKLLRLQLLELGQPLEQVDVKTLSPEAGALARDLRIAACLKPIMPNPGRVDWEIVGSNWARFKDPAMNRCADIHNLRGHEAVGVFLGVRRHLGIEVGLKLAPPPGSQMGDLSKSASLLFFSEAAGPPFGVIATADTNVFARIQFRDAPAPANLVLRIHPDLRLESAQLKDVTLFSRDQLKTEKFAPLANPAALRQMNLTSAQVLILPAPNVTWEQLTGVLAPLAERGLTVDLFVEESR